MPWRARGVRTVSLRRSSRRVVCAVPDDVSIRRLKCVGDAFFPAGQLQTIRLGPRRLLGGEVALLWVIVNVDDQRPNLGTRRIILFRCHDDRRPSRFSNPRSLTSRTDLPDVPAASNRTMTDFDVGVLLTSAVLSSGTSTLVSG